MIRLLFIIVLLLEGCAAPTTQRVGVSNQQTLAEAEKQMQLAVQDRVNEQKRVFAVHWKLTTAGASMCPQTAPAYGVIALTRVNGPTGDAMAKLYGVTAAPTVVYVQEGSPAAHSGLRLGDQITSALSLPTSDLKALSERLRTATPGAQVPLTISRGGQSMPLSITPVAACSYPIALDDKPVVNAYADGQRILVTRGMVSFAKTEEELALVISHEMAHNSMKHMDAKRQNAAGGLVADLALAILSRGAYKQSTISQAAAQAYSQEFEAEADYVGLYFMATAGYEIDEAPNFWRRMAAANPKNIAGSHAASHPSTAYRMVALEEAVKEIAAKRAANLALVPTMKEGKQINVGGTQAPATGSETCLGFAGGKCSK